MLTILFIVFQALASSTDVFHYYDDGGETSGSEESCGKVAITAEKKAKLKKADKARGFLGETSFDNDSWVTYDYYYTNQKACDSALKKSNAELKRILNSHSGAPKISEPAKQNK